MDIRKNIGKTDRTIRFIIAAILAGFLFTHNIPAGRWEFFSWVTVAVLVISGLDETCPLYLVLGRSTRRKQTT